MSDDRGSFAGELRIAAGTKFGLVHSRFNAFVVERLVSGATQCLLDHGVGEQDIINVQVPGAWELPWAAARLATSGKVGAVIALGAVIRGDTAHFDYVAGQASEGLLRVMLDTGVPVAFGLLTTDNDDQARARASDEDNRGTDAALTALEMVSLSDKLRDGGL